MATSLTDFQGNPVPDASVNTQLANDTSASNPVVQEAETGAAQTANSRGLLNSSIAAGAGQSAAIGAAMPEASQDASQIQSQNLQTQNLDSAQEIAGENVASNNEQQLAGATASFSNGYNNSFNAIVNNPSIPADTRDAYLTNIATLSNNDQNLLESIYGVDLGGSVDQTPGALPPGTS